MSEIGPSREAVTMLSHAEIGAVDDALCRFLIEVETLGGKDGEERLENFVVREFRHVFHAHDVGLQLADESRKFMEQLPLVVFRSAVSLRVF